MKYNDIKFVIVGGGTAGWITALKLKKHFPENNITVIESSDIGILGAGEGTTPHFPVFLEDVGINIFSFINETKATLKTGIKFTNWHGDGKHYYHPFTERNCGFDNVSHFLPMMKMANGEDLNDISVLSVCSEHNKIPANQFNGRWNFDANFALHFDARLAAEYLKKVATQRGVDLIDCKVSSATTDVDNNITSINLENGTSVECNFVFDCTGFKRMFVGDFYKSTWLDYQDSLPADRALPFFIQNDTNVVPPYTEAIAMKCGWVWKIPVQGRYGCGYVFDSSYASDDEIAEEIREKFGDVTIPRFFSFKAGYYQDVWAKNCIAVGLSSGFIEPLEATSIWVSIMSLNFLVDNCLPGILNNDGGEFKKLYNTFVRETNSQVKDFLQLHYLTERNDSKFWQEYKTKNKISDRFDKYKDIDSIYDYFEESRKKFTMFSPYWVFSGTKFYNNDVFKKHVDGFLQIPVYSNMKQILEEYKASLKNYCENNATDHDFFLKDLKNYYIINDEKHFYP